MKKSLVCPKCDCRELYVVDTVTQPHSESSNSIHPLWLVATPAGKDETGVEDGTRYRSHACKLEAWVCSACGLVEWYAQNTGELALLARSYAGGVRVVRSKGEAPYR